MVDLVGEISYEMLYIVYMCKCSTCISLIIYMTEIIKCKYYIYIIIPFK